MKTKILKPEPLCYEQRFVMTFIMLSVIKNLPKINILELKYSDPDEIVINEGLTLKTTGVAAMSGCTTTDVMVHNAANLLLTMLTGSKLRPQTYTTSQVKSQKRITVDLYNKVIRFMKGAVNDVAEASGNVNDGVTLAIGCGGRLAKKSTSTQPDFAVTDAGPGWIKVHARKAVKGMEGHLFRCAIVTSKGMIPLKANCVDYVSLECTIEINDLPSGTILAINHAGIIPVRHSKIPIVITPVKLKKATKLPVSKKNHPIFSYTSPDPYIWDGWIYVVIL
ncbi:MAG: hypothetical protein ABR968_00270 [Bacteroidales bacterium]|jgi:hypothetical protein